MEQNNLLCDQQFGFRKKRSTEIAATLFFDDVKQYVNDNGLAGAIFIDICKAFDTIAHPRILEKLSLYGVFDTEHSWLTDYLFNRRIYVNYAGILSNPEPVFNGVPQGSILRPLFFIIYNLHLPNVLRNCKVIKYADDTVIYVSNKDFDLIEKQLSEDMEAIDKLRRDNELILNLKRRENESDNVWNQTDVVQTQRRVERFVPKQVFVTLSEAINPLSLFIFK